MEQPRILVVDCDPNCENHCQYAILSLKYPGRVDMFQLGTPIEPDQYGIVVFAGFCGCMRNIHDDNQVGRFIEPLEQLQNCGEKLVFWPLIGNRYRTAKSLVDLIWNIPEANFISPMCSDTTEIVITRINQILDEQPDPVDNGLSSRERELIRKHRSGKDPNQADRDFLDRPPALTEFNRPREA